MGGGWCKVLKVRGRGEGYQNQKSANKGEGVILW